MTRDTDEDPLILHCFADHGTEAEILDQFGDVVRVGINARDTNGSAPVKADAKQLPFAESTTFDFGLFHPPCTKWSDMPNANKDGEAENLIPLSRDIGHEFCDYWVIENKPRAPLHDPVFLDGDMFGLPVDYERAFETNFPIEQPPQQSPLIENESSSYFYSEKSRAWWASVKGLHPDRYTKQALCKNSLPAPYVRYLVRSWLDASARATGPSDYAEYDKRKTAEKNAAQHHTLTKFSSPATDGGTDE